MRHLLSLLFVTLLLLACGVLAPPASAVVNGEPMPDNKALDAVGAFSLTGWMGVNVGAGHAQQQNNWFGAATLVSPRHIITARHVVGKHPKPGQYVVRFRRKPDGSLGSLKQGPDSYEQVRVMRWEFSKTGGDVALGVLEHEVTHIPPMPIAWDLPENEPFDGMVAGWGSINRQVGASGPRIELRAGDNVLIRTGRSIHIQKFPVKNEEVGKKDDGTPITKPLVKKGDVAVPNMHDSGGALIVKMPDGRLMLAGVISTYRGGTWLGQFADDKDFPLKPWASGGEKSDD